jgi:hypothetical protein
LGAMVWCIIADSDLWFVRCVFIEISAACMNPSSLRTLGMGHKLSLRALIQAGSVKQHKLTVGNRRGDLRSPLRLPAKPWLVSGNHSYS